MDPHARIDATTRRRIVTADATGLVNVRATGGYRFIWGDGLITEWQDNPIVQHTYEHNLGTAAYKNGLGRKLVTVQVRDEAGT